jgi:hypothetical protein
MSQARLKNSKGRKKRLSIQSRSVESWYLLSCHTTNSRIRRLRDMTQKIG